MVDSEERTALPSEGLPTATPQEQVAEHLALKMVSWIQAAGGRFVELDGAVWLLLNGKEVRLEARPDNLDLADIFVRSTGATVVTQLGRRVMARVQIHALERARRTSYRSFSAIHRNRVFLPLAGQRTLRIAEDRLDVVPNGEDGLWLEHPCGQPFEFDERTAEGSGDATVGLNLFRELLVDTQTAAEPSLRWLLALNAIFVGILRDLVNARLITLMTGPSGAGKTTAAQRFLTLLGLGDVLGDHSLAAISRSKDIGLMVLDNREQHNVDVGLHSHLLHLSTGGSRARADINGRVHTLTSRPVTLITSIEGVQSQELARRCIEVHFEPSSGTLDNCRVLHQIAASRSEIFTGMVRVIQRFLRVRASGSASRIPVPGVVKDFPAHFRLLCELALAFGQASQDLDLPTFLIGNWQKCLAIRESPETMLEWNIAKLAALGRLGPGLDFSWQDRSGQLFVAQAAQILAGLHTLPGGTQGLPTDPSALSRRLRSMHFNGLAVLTAEAAPGIHELRRTSSARSIGIFVPADTSSATHHADDQFPPIPPLSIMTERDRLAHAYLTDDHTVAYLWEYSSGNSDAQTRFIHTFKLDPRFLDGPAALRKLKAIEHAAVALSRCIPQQWRDWLFVPMPGSSPHDNRLIETLGLVMPRITLAPILRQRGPTVPKQKSINPSERAEELVVSDYPVRECPGLVIVDDVISSGSHFAAAVHVLRQAFPGVTAVGLVLARRGAPPMASAATAGSLV